MEKEKVVDYFQAMRDFDNSQGKKADDFDMPLKSSEEDGGVDYQSPEWARTTNLLLFGGAHDGN